MEDLGPLLGDSKIFNFLSICDTAISDDPDIEKYSKDGVIDSFFEKPIRLKSLCDRVRDEGQRYHLESSQLKPRQHTT